jgi:hypothetical protein
MRRALLIERVKIRKNEMNITIDNLAKFSHVGVRTVNRFLGVEDVKISTVENITNVLGLDFAGNEILSLDELRQRRALEKSRRVFNNIQEDAEMKRELTVDVLERLFLSPGYISELWVL